jgi:uncharacterized protein (TIGR02246 family)
LRRGWSGQNNGDAPHNSAIKRALCRYRGLGNQEVKPMRELFAIIIGVVLVGTLTLTPAATDSVRAEIQAFVKSYVEAQNKVDASALMEMVSKRTGVTSVGMGEITRGWEAIRAEVDEVVGSEGLFKISVGTIDVEELGPSFALALAPCTITFNSEHGSLQLRGAVSLVLEKAGDKWTVFHEHTSVRLPEAEGD